MLYPVTLAGAALLPKVSGSTNFQLPSSLTGSYAKAWASQRLVGPRNQISRTHTNEHISKGAPHMLLHKACRSRFPQTRICNLNKGSQRAL